jgi:hypothetical protein
MTQFATRVIGGYKSLSPSLLERIATTEKKKVRRSVNQILVWDFERVIMAHSSIIEQNGKEQFQKGYERFLGPPGLMMVDRSCTFKMITSVSAIRHTHHESQSNTNKYDRTLANPEHGNLD